MHQNSIFDLFEGFSKINVLVGRAQNAATATVLKQGAQSFTVETRSSTLISTTVGVEGEGGWRWMEKREERETEGPFCNF